MRFFPGQSTWDAHPVRDAFDLWIHNWADDAATSSAPLALIAQNAGLSQVQLARASATNAPAVEVVCVRLARYAAATPWVIEDYA